MSQQLINAKSLTIQSDSLDIETSNFAITGGATVDTLDVTTSIELPGVSPLNITTSRVAYTVALVDSNSTVPNGKLALQLFKLNNMVFFNIYQILGFTQFTSGSNLNPTFPAVIPANYRPLNDFSTSCCKYHVGTAFLAGMCNMSTGGNIEIVGTWLNANPYIIASVTGYYLTA